MKIEIDIDVGNMREEMVRQASESVAMRIEPEIRTEVVDTVLVEVRKRAEEELERVLTTPFLRTNRYGQALDKGEPMTLAEAIVAEARKLLTDEVSEGYNKPKRTRAQSFISDEVARHIDRELTEALNEAKAEVREAIKARGAEALGKALEQIATRRI